MNVIPISIRINAANRGVLLSYPVAKVIISNIVSIVRADIPIAM